MAPALWPAGMDERLVDGQEIMDGPDADPVLLDRTYHQFKYVNAALGGWHRIYRTRIRPVLRRGQPNSVVDIGSGGGDITRALGRWARRDGFDVSITGVDPDGRAHAHATAHPAVEGVSFRKAYSSDLVREGAQFDVVLSNFMLHHLTEPELQGLLDDSERLCTTRAIHADIQRSRLAYLLFSAGTRPFFHRSFIREDGLMSIRRSYTPSELALAAPAGWRVDNQSPYRNLLVFDAGGTRPGPGQQPDS